MLLQSDTLEVLLADLEHGIQHCCRHSYRAILQQQKSGMRHSFLK